MKNRILSVILAVVVMFSSVDMSVFASELSENSGEAILTHTEYMLTTDADVENNDISMWETESASEIEDDLKEDEKIANDESVDEEDEIFENNENDYDQIVEENNSVELEEEITEDTYTVKSTASLNSEVMEKIKSYKKKWPNKTSSEGMQCLAFVNTLAKAVFGSNPGASDTVRGAANGNVSNGWTCHYVTSTNCNTLSVEPGDIIDAPTGDASHTVMVLAVSGKNIICVQAYDGINYWVFWGDEYNNDHPNGYDYRYFNYGRNRATLEEIYKYGSQYKGWSGGTIRLWKPSDTLKQNAKAYSATTGGASQLTISISDSDYPPTLEQGSSWTCKGTISSNYNITQVGGYIIQYDNGKEKTPQVYSVVQHPNTMSYSLANSAIDTGLLFNKLSPGTYYYKITAHDSSGKATSVEREFMIKGTSTLKISGEAYPPTLKQGTSWTCKGTITSNYRLTQIGCYINQYPNNEEKQIYKAVIHPEKTMTYSIDNSDVNNALQFNKLPVGTYYYTVTAHDASGQKSYMIYRKEFKVVESESTLKISGATYPTSMDQGSDFTCQGTISSNYNITVANFYIFQLVDNVQKDIYHKMVNPNVKSYSIDNSDIKNALLFKNLPAGGYYYRVTAEDSSGKWLNLVNIYFTVKAPESTLKIDGVVYPVEINQGSDFTCQGTISSNYNITVANFYIFQLVDGVKKDIYHKMVTPNVKSYSIDNSDIKNALLFKNLPAGGYYYRVTAEDSSGKWLNLVNAYFTIIAQCNFSGDITSPASGTVVYIPNVEIQAQAADSYGIKSFSIKLSGAAEKTITVDAVKSGNSYVCNYTMDLSIGGSYEVTVEALCNNGSTHRVGSRTFTYEMKDNEPYVAGLEDKIYTGSEIRQDIKLYFNNKLLKEGFDYNLKYKNNVNVYTYAKKDYDDFEAELKAGGKRVRYNSFNPGKAPQVIIKMKGNYSGSHIVYYQIKPADISGEKVNIDNMTVTFSGRKQTPTPILIWNGRKLKYGTDFRIPEYDALKSDKSAFAQPGSYNLTIVGKKNFSGEIPIVLTISKDIKQIAITKATVKGIKACVWTGEQIKPTDFSVSYKKDAMSVDNGDFVVSYGENKAVGTGSITLTGTGKDTDGDGYSYIGSKTIAFKITGIPMSKVTVSGVNKSYTYTGAEIKPEAVLTYRANRNTENVDLTKEVNYTVAYQNNKDKGTATIIFKGIENGGCTGVKKQTFKITASGISASETDETAFEQIKIAFKDSTNVVDGIYDAPYMKGGVRPEIVVTSGDKTLEAGKDYTVKYSNNTKLALSTDVKAPTITVSGKGNYTGSRQIYFSIVTKSLTNENGIKVVANDKVISTNKNGYRQSFKVYDADGSLLGANDYDTKNVVYTLINTKNEDGTMAEVNRILDENSFVGADSVIQISVTGKGNYLGGIATGTYRIIGSKYDINKATIQINKQTYTGNAIEITDQSQFKTGKVFIKNGQEKQTLTLGKDIEVVPGSYVKNVNKGTAKVTFRGINGYGGTKTVSFKIGVRSIADFWR